MNHTYVDSGLVRSTRGDYAIACYAFILSASRCPNTLP